MKQERDLVADMVADLISSIHGVPGHHVLSGINGNIPSEWCACDLSAHPCAEPKSAVAIFCSAKRRDKPFSRAAGVKIVVEVGTLESGLLLVADALAERLRAKIASMTPKDGKIRIALDPGAVLPERKTAGASGYDLCALTGVQIQPGRLAVIETGVTLEMPIGMEAQIRPRSGLASKGVVGTFGTVDADFRAACRVMLTNQGTEAYTVNAGDRVAQLVFARVELPELEVVEADKLTSTDRGAGSFGSTGR